MKLIDKDSVVAEIERRRNTWRYGSSTEAKYRMEEREEIFDFINSLETMEVKFEKYAMQNVPMIDKECDV